MIRYSVKKPFTILVLVIGILMLAAVSLTQMTTDLLPEISTPYLLVITTYPGASPEKVELEVTDPIESVLSTVNDVKNVTSTSAENYSLITLEFEEDTNMDSALVKVNTQIDTIKDHLPERCSAPSITEISLDMLATMYVAVYREDMDIYELTDYVEDEIEPYFQRQEGVANVTAIGLVRKNIEVSLDEEKVDALNDKLAAYISDKLDDAKDELDKAQSEIDKGKRDLANGEKELTEARDSTSEELASATRGLNEALATQSSYNANLNSLKAEQAALTAEKQAYVDSGVVEAHDGLNKLFGSIPSMLSGLETAKSKLDDATIEQLQTAVDGLETVKTMLVPALTGLSTDYDAAEATTVEVNGANVPVVAAVNAALTQLQIPITVSDADTAAAALSAFNTMYNSAASGLSTAKSTKSALNSVPSVATAYPVDVTDAAEHPEKVTNTVNLLKVMNQLAAANGQSAAVSNDILGSLTADNVKQLYNAVDVRLAQIDTELSNLTTELMAAQAAVDTVNSSVSEAMDQYETVEVGKITAAAEFGSNAAQIAAGKTALSDAQEKLNEAMDTYKESRDAALKSANLDTLLSLDTLSQLLSAQNFSMPAGYISDADDEKYLVKVGTEIEDADDLAGMLIADIDGVGKIYLSDIAEVVTTDNADDSYTRMNGTPAVLLSIYKASTAGTSTVSKTCNKALTALQNEVEGLHIVPLMDQGLYIDFFISSVVRNMLSGAVLAIIVLVVFMRSVKPTLVVAFSIPFSVLLAILAMYFTDISINIMSLSGLALGIGMLVDNSIVVIENIYRLRGKGLEAPRAAVQGTKQVAGAIVSSTLTTVCVFLPMIFTTGLVRQLMVPFALTITFSLAASLLVATTAAPAIGSVILKNSVPKGFGGFGRLQDAYAKFLGWCLKRKVIPLAVAIGLLIASIAGVASMGYVLIPDMSSNQVFVTVAMDEGTSMEDAYAHADAITDKVLTVDGVEQVGVMTNLESGFVGVASGSADNDYLDYSFYLVLDDDIDKIQELERVKKDLSAALEDEEGCEIEVSESGAGDFGALMSSGLTLNIYGDDTEKLTEISEDIMKIVEGRPAFSNVSNGQEDGDDVIHVVVDKDDAMAKGFPVAQIYAEIASRLTTDKNATSITMDGNSLDVTIIDETDPLTVENLLDMEFEREVTDAATGETNTETYRLRSFAHIVNEKGLATVERENGTHMMTVSADTNEGYNTARESEALMSAIASYELPSGYSIELGGEAEQVNDMMSQMAKLMLLGIVLVYLVMVAQFQSLLSPFIILFTVPLAFTGGLFGLIIFGEQISIVSLMGFLVLMGTVVNNGIVFVDYTNQLRLAGLGKHEALIATGRTRMRPILMTALTTILAMGAMVFSRDISAGISRGMAVVVSVGLLYATFMTLFIVPILYDILYRKEPREIDVGDDLDEVPDEISEYLEENL